MSELNAIREGIAESEDELVLTRAMAQLAGAGYRTGSIPATNVGNATAQVGGTDQIAGILLDTLRRGGLLDPNADMDYANVRDEIIMSQHGAEVLERYRDAATEGARQRRAKHKVARRSLLLWASENPDEGSNDFLASPYGHYFGQPFSRECVERASDELKTRGLVEYIETSNVGGFACLTLTSEGDACVVDFDADLDAWEQAQRQETTLPSISNVFHSQVGNVVQGGSVYGGLAAYIDVNQSDPHEVAALLLAVVKASALAGELSEPETRQVAEQVMADLEAATRGELDKGRLERIGTAMKTLGAKAAGGAATAIGSGTVQTVLLPILTGAPT